MTPRATTNPLEGGGSPSHFRISLVSFVRVRLYDLARQMNVDRGPGDEAGEAIGVILDSML